MRQTLCCLLLLILTGTASGGLIEDWYANHDPNEWPIRMAELAPTIDGVIGLDEWPDANFWHDLNMNHAGGDIVDQNDIVDGEWPPDNNNIGTAYRDIEATFLWDDVSNRVFFVVTGSDDAHFFTNEHVWWAAADSLEFYFDANNMNKSFQNQGSTSPINHKYAQGYRIGPTNTGGCWSSRTPDFLDEFAATVVGNRITYEVAMVPYYDLIKDPPPPADGLPTTGTLIKDLDIGDTVGVSLAWKTRWDVYVFEDSSDSDSLAMSPCSWKWKDAIWITDHKLSTGDTTRAYAPSPGKAENAVSQTKDLEWIAGMYSKTENVYFGTSLAGMTQIGFDIAAEPHTAQSVVNPASAQPYPLGQTYYWRVDDVNVTDACHITGSQWYFTTEGAAYDPSPVHEKTGLQPSLTVSWTAGAGTEWHDVYLSSNRTFVDGEHPTYKIASGQALADVNCDVSGLTLNTTYYWKVNEVSNSGADIVVGTIWEFKIADYIIIEDFENYITEGDIQSVWSGQGITPTPTTLPGEFYHGDRAMQLGLNASSPPYTGRVWRDMSHDFTIDGTTALSIMFKSSTFVLPGSSDIFVGLESGSIGGGDLLVGLQQYGNPDAANTSEYTEWFMDMGLFGVDLNDITKLTIGYGTPAAPFIASGQFDYIRISQPRYMCISRPAADINNDCKTDRVDVAELISNWLDYDHTVTVFDANMKKTDIAQKYEEPNSWWADPGLRINDDMYLGEANDANWNDWVDVDDYLLDNFYDKTIIAWVTQHTESPLRNLRSIFGTDTEYRAHIVINDANVLCARLGQNALSQSEIEFGYYTVGDGTMNIGQEYFVALSIESDVVDSNFYVDGINYAKDGNEVHPTVVRHGEHEDSSGDVLPVHKARLLGACISGFGDDVATKQAMPMTIRDFGIYDRALTAAEIGDLSWNGDPTTDGNLPDLLWYKFDETSGHIAYDSCVTGGRSGYHPIVDPNANIGGSTATNQAEINLVDFATLVDDYPADNMAWWP